MRKRMHVFFSGMVQGVGFRFTALRLAHKYKLKGWVKNMLDSRVELIAQGPEEDLASFLQSLQREFKPEINDAQVEYSNSLEAFDDFKIQF